jgi:hypothetical protein
MPKALIATASGIALALLLGDPASAQQPQANQSRALQSERYNPDGTCKPGYIPCIYWCARYATRGENCMSGTPKSCDTKPYGSRSCVVDAPG